MISSEASLQKGSGMPFCRGTFISMECDLIHALRFFSVAHIRIALSNEHNKAS